MWNWDKQCEFAFQEAKKLVTSDLVLCHHAPKRAIRLACDALPFGVDAVISHIMDDGKGASESIFIENIN